MSTCPLQLKLVVLGDSGVGKTSILTRFVLQEFSQSYQATVGADFLFKELIVDGIKFSLQIWDTAGQERFNSLGNSFYRGTDCCLLVFDLTNSESFDHASNWKKEFLYRTGNSPGSIPMILIGNKRDLSSERTVDLKLAKAWAGKEGLIYCEVSAKDSTRIEEAFINASRLCMNKQAESNRGFMVKSLILSQVSEEKPKKCCN